MPNIPLKDFIKEHKRLIGVFNQHLNSTKQLEKEKKDQEAELKKILKRYK